MYRYLDNPNHRMQISESRTIHMDGMTPAELPAYLANIAGDLEDVTLVLYAEDDYDGPVMHQSLDGWRDMTDAEIVKYEREVEQRNTYKRQRDARELDRIKREHPELFS